jgi:hypothetical protein
MYLYVLIAKLLQIPEMLMQPFKHTAHSSTYVYLILTEQRCPTTISEILVHKTIFLYSQNFSEDNYEQDI